MTHEAQQHRVAMRTLHMNEATIRAEARVSRLQFSAERRVVHTAHVQDAADAALQQTHDGSEETEKGVEKDVEVEKYHEGATIVERQNVDLVLEKHVLGQDLVQIRLEVDSQTERNQPFQVCFHES